MNTTNVRKHIRRTRKGKSVVRYHRRHVKKVKHMKSYGAYEDDYATRLERDPWGGQPIKKAKPIYMSESVLYKQKPYVQPKLTPMQRFNAWKSTVQTPEIHFPKLPKFERETKYVDFDTYVRKMKGERKPFTFKDMGEKLRMARENLRFRQPRAPEFKPDFGTGDIKDIPLPKEESKEEPLIIKTELKPEDFVTFKEYEKAKKKYEGMLGSGKRVGLTTHRAMLHASRGIRKAGEATSEAAAKVVSTAQTVSKKTAEFVASPGRSARVFHRGLKSDVYPGPKPRRAGRPADRSKTKPLGKSQFERIKGSKGEYFHRKKK